MSRAAALLLLLFLLAVSASAAFWSLVNVTGSPVLRATRPMVVYWPSLTLYNISGAVTKEFIVAAVVRMINFNVTVTDQLDDGSLATHNVTLRRPIWKLVTVVSFGTMSVVPWRPTGEPPVFYNSSDVSQEKPIELANYGAFYDYSSPIAYDDVAVLKACGLSITVKVVSGKTLRVTGAGDVLLIDDKNCVKWLIATSNYGGYNMTYAVSKNTTVAMFIWKNPATDDGYYFTDDVHLWDRRWALRASAFPASGTLLSYFEVPGYAIHAAVATGYTVYGIGSSFRRAGDPYSTKYTAFSPLDRTLNDDELLGVVNSGFPLGGGRAAAVTIVWPHLGRTHTAVMYSRAWEQWLHVCNTIKYFWSTGHVGAGFMTSDIVFGYYSYKLAVAPIYVYTPRRAAVFVNNSTETVTVATGQYTGDILAPILHYDVSDAPPGARVTLYAPGDTNYYIFVYRRVNSTYCPLATSVSVSVDTAKYVFDGSRLVSAPFTTDDFNYTSTYEQYLRQLLNAYANLTNTLLSLLNSTAAMAQSYGNGTFRVGNTVYSYPGSQVASLLGQNSVSSVKTAVSLVKLRAVSAAGPAGSFSTVPAAGLDASIAAAAAAGLGIAWAASQRNIKLAMALAGSAVLLSAVFLTAVAGPVGSALIAVGAALLALAAAWKTAED
jgi:hypothetical protein